MRVNFGQNVILGNVDDIKFDTVGELCDMCYQMREHCDELVDSPEVDVIGRENIKHAKELLVLLGDLFIRATEGSRELDDLHQD